MMKIYRDRLNSQEKMCDFILEFLKCIKFHGQFTEGVNCNNNFYLKLKINKTCLHDVTNDVKLSIAK